jgi:hypothetical protein
VCHIVEGGGFWDFGKLYLSLPTNLYPLIKATNNCPSRPRRIALFGIIGGVGLIKAYFLASIKHANVPPLPCVS